MTSTDSERHLVVMSDEEQYSIWPSGKPLPHGWRSAGFEGLEAECLAFIDEHWTDMRPRSVKLGMQHDQSR